MIATLWILGGVWVGVSALFVVALACAARKSTPYIETEADVLEEAA